MLEDELEQALRGRAEEGCPFCLEAAEIADTLAGMPLAPVLLQLVSTLAMILPPLQYVHMLDELSGEVSFSNLFLAYVALSGSAKNAVYAACGPPTARLLLGLIFRAGEESPSIAAVFSHIRFDQATGSPVSIVQDANTTAFFEFLAADPMLDKFQYATAEGENFMMNLKSAVEGKGAALERSKRFHSVIGFGPSSLAGTHMLPSSVKPSHCT